MGVAMIETYDAWKRRVKLLCGATSFAEYKTGNDVLFSSAYDNDFDKVGNWIHPEYSKLRHEDKMK